MIRELQTLPSRNRVWLNGVGLADIDPSIHIHDVSYGAPGISTQTVTHARHHGARVTRQRMDSSTVTVSIMVREYDQQERQEVMNRIAAWAMTGGVLTTDDRPGKRLHVVCTTAPSIESSLRWTQQQDIVFTAFDNPFWEDVTPKSAVLTGTSASGNLYGAGSAADPFVTARIAPSQTLTTLTLNAGDTSFYLRDLSIQPGAPLVIDYDETQTLRIYREGYTQSYLSARLATSSDDLIIPRGKFSTVSFSANTSCTVTFYVRGLYL